jgi:hypothetical protein
MSRRFYSFFKIISLERMMAILVFSLKTPDATPPQYKNQWHLMASEKFLILL